MRSVKESVLKEKKRHTYPIVVNTIQQQHLNKKG